MTHLISIFVLLLNFFGFEGNDQVAEALYRTSTSTSGSKYLTLHAAEVHVLIATNVATADMPADILLGMSFVESRHQPNAVSRVEGGKRLTGVPRWTYPPKGVTGPYFCGVTQASAGMSWKKCVELQDLFVAYVTTVEEMEKWLKVCKGNLHCALTGYNAGFPGIKQGTPYAGWVKYRARLLKKPAPRPNI